MRFEGDAEIKPCPTAATIASFVDARLSQAERNRVVMHMAECERCREVIGAVVWAVRQTDGGTDGNK